MQFTFNNKIYIQNDGVAVGSPLDTVLANLFMVKLETALIQNLSGKLSFGDVLLCEERHHQIVLDTLNNFQNKKIKFTFEEEIDGRILFPISFWKKK